MKKISFIKIQQQIKFKLYLSLDKKDRLNSIGEKGKEAVKKELIVLFDSLIKFPSSINVSLA
jgi:hypothetical protein